MIRYEEKHNAKSLDNIKVQVSDFSGGLDLIKGQNITKLNCAYDTFNFSFNKGVLTQGMGIKQFTTPTSMNSDENQIAVMKNNFEVDVKSIWLYRQWNTVQNKRTDKIMFWGGDNKMWYFKVNDQYPLYVPFNTMTFTKKPNMFNFKLENLDCVLLSNDTDSTWAWNGSSGAVNATNCPNIVDICVHKGKLYSIIGGEQNYIRYSTNTSVVDWTSTLGQDEGIIEINDGLGKINKLVSFMGYLYAIRDYGVIKITTYENKTDYALNNIFVSGNKIYSNSVQVCGDELVMLTKDSLIKFDGTTAKKIDLKFEDMFANIDNKNCVACFHAGKYYLALKMNYGDSLIVGSEANNGYVNNTLLCYDLTTQKYELLRGVDITDMISAQAYSLNKLMLCFNGANSKEIGEITNNGKDFSNNLYKYWKSPLTDLGFSNKLKHIKSVSIMSKYDCSLTVFTEKQSKTFNIKGSNVLSKFNVRLTGKQIGFKIESTQQNAFVSNLMLDVDLMELKNI